MLGKRSERRMDVEISQARFSRRLLVKFSSISVIPSLRHHIFDDSVIPYLWRKKEVIHCDSYCSRVKSHLSSCAISPEDNFTLLQHMDNIYCLPSIKKLW